MDGSASFTAPITVKGLQVRHLAFGSTVATPDAAGKITLFYGVTFTTVPFPLVCSGSGGLIVEGNTGTTSSGVAVLRDTTGALITAGLRRVTWCVSGVLA
jgi:hypothetical protein